MAHSQTEGSRRGIVNSQLLDCAAAAMETARCGSMMEIKGAWSRTQSSFRSDVQDCKAAIIAHAYTTKSCALKCVKYVAPAYQRQYKMRTCGSVWCSGRCVCMLCMSHVNK